MEFNESLVKNIIKNQKKFNYDSLPNITLFADCFDKKQVSPFEFYSMKGNEEKTLKLLDVSNNKFYTSNEYHPFEDCCYNFLSNTCLKMIEKELVPSNPILLINCFGYCLHSKMEKIAKFLFNKIVKQHPTEIKKLKIVNNGYNNVNPLHFSIINNLNEIKILLLDYFDIFNFDENLNIDVFLLACQLNNIELIELILNKYKINPFLIDNTKKYGLTYLINNKNEDLIMKLLEYTSLHYKDKNFNNYLIKYKDIIVSNNLNKIKEYINKILYKN